jgi:chaperone required for assembly of F1-ATPase
MTPSFKKRFWTNVDVVAVEGGFEVSLDARRVITPAKSDLVLPTAKLAHCIAAEWQAQVEVVNPNTMPATRMANSAIDKIAQNHFAVAEMLAEYGGTDLLCYRAEAPLELVAWQEKEWDPILAWARQVFSVELATTAGVMHVAQQPEDLRKFGEKVHEFGNFELAAFHDLVTISGSLVTAFTVTENWMTAQQAWESATVDERWQQQLWGIDDEAQKNNALKQRAFEFAHAFLLMLG